METAIAMGSRFGRKNPPQDLFARIYEFVKSPLGPTKCGIATSKGFVSDVELAEQTGMSDRQNGV